MWCLVGVSSVCGEFVVIWLCVLFIICCSSIYCVVCEWLVSFIVVDFRCRNSVCGLRGLVLLFSCIMLFWFVMKLLLVVVFRVVKLMLFRCVIGISIEVGL